MKTTLNPAQIQFFEKNGYLVIEKLLSNRDVTGYRKLYEDFLSNKVDSQGLRSDLGGHMDTPKLNKATERITQIMRPSLIVKDLAAKALHLKSLDNSWAMIWIWILTCLSTRHPSAIQQLHGIKIAPTGFPCLM
jgi:hypothetical protein